jgi:transposase
VIAICGEIGDYNHSSSINQLQSCLALHPCQEQSEDNQTAGSVRKSNRHIRSILYGSVRAVRLGEVNPSVGVLYEQRRGKGKQ